MNKQAIERLSGRPAVGGHSGMSAVAMLFFGLPFVAFGAWITLVSFEILPMDPSKVNAPMWVLTVCGLAFFLAGLAVWKMAWARASREWQRKKSAAMHRGDPIMEDYPWDRTGYSPDRWKPVAQGWAGAIFSTIFLSIFNWWGFGSGNGPWIVKIVVVVFDLILILVWWKSFQITVHAIKFGKTRLVFQQFPYDHKDGLQAKIELPMGLERVEEATLTLRCVKEYYEQHGHGKNRRNTLVHKQLWAEEQKLTGEKIGQWPRFLNVAFTIPAEVTGTTMNIKEPIFWELKMELAVPGVNLNQRYLVPVYDRNFGSHSASSGSGGSISA